MRENNFAKGKINSKRERNYLKKRRTNSKMKGIPKRGKQFYRSGKHFQKGCERWNNYKKINKGETNLKREVIIQKERNNFQKGRAI